MHFIDLEVDPEHSNERPKMAEFTLITQLHKVKRPCVRVKGIKAVLLGQGFLLPNDRQSPSKTYPKLEKGLESGNNSSIKVYVSQVVLDERRWVWPPSLSHNPSSNWLFLRNTF